MERVGVARRAEAGAVNVAADDTRLDQLVPVGGPQIESKPIAGSREPAVGPPVAGVHEHPDHLFPDLVAARSDARTEGGHQVDRPGAERVRHRPDRRSRHSGRGTAPAGVHGRHRPEPPIRQQDGNAVRRDHCDRVGRVGGDRGVGDGPIIQLVRSSPWQLDVDVAAVHLNRPDEAVERRADRVRETTPCAPTIRMAPPQLEPARREAVRSGLPQGGALEDRPPRSLDPAEAGAWNHGWQFAAVR